MKEQALEVLLRYIDNTKEAKGALSELLVLFDVSGCQFEAYARFCIECDRQGLKPIKYEDYLKIG